MLNVCAINNSELYFSINADVNEEEFAMMSPRPMTLAEKKLLRKAKQENSVHNVQPYELPAALFLTDDKAHLSDREMTFLSKMFAEFPVLVSAETDPAAIQKMLDSTRIDTVVVAASAAQSLKDALTTCSLSAPILRVA